MTQDSVPRTRPLDDRLYREETYFHIWSTNSSDDVCAKEKLWAYFAPWKATPLAKSREDAKVRQTTE